MVNAGMRKSADVQLATVLNCIEAQYQKIIISDPLTSLKDAPAVYLQANLF